MAEVGLLSPLNDTLMIKRVANMFNLDPDDVYNKSGDWLLVWLYSDKQEREYQDRYQEANRIMNSKT